MVPNTKAVRCVAVARNFRLRGNCIAMGFTRLRHPKTSKLFSSLWIFVDGSNQRIDRYRTHTKATPQRQRLKQKSRLAWRKEIQTEAPHRHQHDIDA